MKFPVALPAILDYKSLGAAKPPIEQNKTPLRPQRRKCLFDQEAELVNLSQLIYALKQEGYNNFPHYVTIWRRASKGDLPHVHKIGGRWFFHLSDLPAIAQALDCRK